MITLIDGVPGAGKSYYLVRQISLDSNKYYKIFTNLNEFKFDKFDNVFPLVESEFVGLMDECKLIYDDEGTTDKDILEFLVSKDFLSFDGSKYKPVLIVYDEVHNILGGRGSDLWTWILTYHRHLFIDFLFATQDAALISRSYHKLFQKIYRALPNDRALTFSALLGKSASNRYQEHLKLPIVDGKYGTFLKNMYIKKEDKYYDLYKAGDVVRSKSVFTRFIYVFIVLAVLVLLGFVLFIKHLTGSSDDVSSSDHNKTSRVIHYSDSSSDDVSDSVYLVLHCVSTACSNKQFNIHLHVSDLKVLLKNTDSTYLHSVMHSDDLADLYLLASPRFLDLFHNRSEKNEKGFILSGN